MLRKKSTTRSTGSKLQTTSRNLLAALLALSLLPTSCSRIQKPIEPTVSYTIQDRYLKELPSPFEPLTQDEKSEPWGAEYTLGLHFARDLDLYRAITAFKRGEILAGTSSPHRTLEMQYDSLLAYYLGRRFSDVETAFSTSRLSQATIDFPPFKELLVILYDSYNQLGECARADHIKEIVKAHYPEVAETLTLSTALTSADFCTLESFDPRPYICDFLTYYEANKKSPVTAGVLNAIIPGAGYFYVGKRQTGITALLINGLFIAASVHFFRKGEIAAGAITTSFEAGWYFGGIFGAAEKARFYNECLYERAATPLMNREKLFPIYLLNYSF